MRNEFLLFINHLVYGIWLQQPELTETSALGGRFWQAGLLSVFAKVTLVERCRRSQSAVKPDRTEESTGAEDWKR